MWAESSVKAFTSKFRVVDLSHSTAETGSHDMYLLSNASIALTLIHLYVRILYLKQMMTIASTGTCCDTLTVIDGHQCHEHWPSDDVCGVRVAFVSPRVLSR